MFAFLFTQSMLFAEGINFLTQPNLKIYMEQSDDTLLLHDTTQLQIYLEKNSGKKLEIVKSENVQPFSLYMAKPMAELLTKHHPNRLVLDDTLFMPRAADC